MEQRFEVMLNYTITALEVECLFIADSYLRNFWNNLIISKQIILLKSIKKFLRLALNYWISHGIEYWYPSSSKMINRKVGTWKLAFNIQLIIYFKETLCNLHSNHYTF